MTLGQLIKKIKNNKPAKKQNKRHGEINWGARALQAQKENKKKLIEKAKQYSNRSEIREKFRNKYCKNKKES